jgi:hypothetical protein
MQYISSLRTFVVLIWLVCFHAFGGFASEADRRLQTIRDRFDEGQFNVFSGDFERSYAHPEFEGKIITHFMSLDRDNEHYLSRVESHEESGEWVLESSWNGTQWVDFGRKKIHEFAPLESVAVSISDRLLHRKEKFHVDVLTIEMGLSNPSSYINQCEAITYDEDTRVLSLGRDGIEAVRYYFSDADDDTFYKIEILDPNGNLWQEKDVMGWKRFGDLLLPSSIETFDGDGNFMGQFIVNSISFSTSLPSEEFFVRLPYHENIDIVNLEIREYVTVTEMDEELIAKGDYLKAWKLAYLDSISAQATDAAIGDLLSSISTESSSDPLVSTENSTGNIPTGTLELISERSGKKSTSRIAGMAFIFIGSTVIVFGLITRFRSKTNR